MGQTNDKTEKSRRNAKRQRNLASGQPVVIEQVDAEVLFKALFEVLEKDGAIRIGRTRDRGAWAIGIYGDGPAPYTEYVRGNEDINDYFGGLAEFFAKMP